MPPKGKGRGKAGKKSTSTRRKRREEEEEETESVLVTSDNESDEESEESRPSRADDTQKKKKRKGSSLEERDSSASSRATTLQRREEEEEDEESSSSTVSTATASQKKKKKTQSAPLIFDAQVEADLAEWLQGLPLFYDKHHKEHCDRKKKDGLIADKARELNVDPARLQTWFKNVRDRVNAAAKRIVQHSGDPANDDDLSALTERQKEIFRKFRFLRDYIVPHKRPSKTAGLASSATASQRTATASPQPGPSSASRTEDAPHVPSSEDADDSTTAPPPSGATRRGSVDTHVSSESQVIRQIAQFGQYLASKTDSSKQCPRRKSLADAVLQEGNNLHDRHFRKFSQEIYKVILRYSVLQGEDDERSGQSSSEAEIPTPMPSLPSIPPYVSYQAPRYQQPQQQSYYQPQQQQQPQYYSYPMMPPAPVPPMMRAPASTYTPTAAAAAATSTYRQQQCFSPISPAVSTGTAPTAATTTTSTTPAASPLPPSVSQQASPAADLQSSRRTSTPVPSSTSFGTRDACLPQGPQTPGSGTDILRAVVSTVGGLPSPAAWSQTSSLNWANTSFTSLLNAIPTPDGAVSTPPATATTTATTEQSSSAVQPSQDSGNNNNNNTHDSSTDDVNVN